MNKAFIFRLRNNMGIIQRQGIKNTIISYAGIAIGFVSLIFIQPRYLTQEELGLTRVFFAFSSLIATLLPLGIGNITIRFFPLFRNLDKRHYGYFGFMILFPLVGFVIISLLIFLFRNIIIQYYEPNSRLFTEYFDLTYPFILILGTVGVLSAYCNSIYKTTVPSFLNDVCVRIGVIVLIFLYYFKYCTLNQFMVLYIGIFAVQMLTLVIFIFLYDRPGLKIDFSFLKSQNPRLMWRYGLLLSITSIASLGLKSLDMVLLGIYVPLAKVGIYAIAVFIPTIIEAPYNALDRISSAKISNAWAFDNLQEIRDIYSKSSQYLFLFGGFIFLLINANANAVFTFLPSSFIEGIPVVFIISLATLTNMATGVNDSVIYYSPKYYIGTVMLVLLFALDFVLNVLFIPHYGITGAAYATGIAVVGYNFLKYIFILKKFHMQPFDMKTLKITGIIVLCFFANFLLPVTGGPVADIAIRSSLITLLYAVAVYSLRIAPEFHHYIPFLKKK
jgi:O-antigen/teichoic acid export membrane protein